MVLDGEASSRCPRRPLLDEGEKWGRIFGFYSHVDKGILPEEGGLLSQPHRLLEYFSVIDRAKHEATEEHQERERRRAAMKGKQS